MPAPVSALCHCCQIPVAARQNFGNTKQLVRLKFPGFSKPGLIDNGDAASCHQIEMRCLLAGAEQRLSMEQRDKGGASHAASQLARRRRVISDAIERDSGQTSAPPRFSAASSVSCLMATSRHVPVAVTGEL